MGIKIGAQLYTVREFCKNITDFKKTMKKVADIGYTCVQVSGVGGEITPEQIRETADNYGLDIIITHTNPLRILEHTDDVIADHRTLGAGYIGIGMMPEQYRFSLEGTKRFIDDYNAVAKKISGTGLKFMYHNHALELEKFGGEYVLDIFADGIPEMGFTLDVYWLAFGGGDPALWLRKYPGRVDCIHYKDMRMEGTKQMMCEVMEGNLNWAEIFAASKQSGVKWAFVEQDDCYGADPFKCLEISFNNLSKHL
jgi:sugar phosphate isomerase/epimerase